MKKYCVKHHLSYEGRICPLCEKERINSFKVTKNTNPVLGQAPRELYEEESTPMSDYEMEQKLMSKFGNISRL